jgi:acyl-ACP thioesterase
MEKGQPFWWIIQVLRDSNGKDIVDENVHWIILNAEKLKLHICVEDCQLSYKDLKKNTMNDQYIQDGEIVQSLDYSKQAIIITEESLVFRYDPADID